MCNYFENAAATCAITLSFVNENPCHENEIDEIGRKIKSIMRMRRRNHKIMIMSLICNMHVFRACKIQTKLLRLELRYVCRIIFRSHRCGALFVCLANYE